MHKSKQTALVDIIKIKFETFINGGWTADLGSLKTRLRLIQDPGNDQEQLERVK